MPAILTVKIGPLALFAVIWVPQWTLVRKIKEGEVTTDLFGFLTTAPGTEVGAVHLKAIPVILTVTAEMDAWMAASWGQAAVLQQPLPDGPLGVATRGGKKDW